MSWEANFYWSISVPTKVSAKTLVLILNPCSVLSSNAKIILSIPTCKTSSTYNNDIHGSFIIFPSLVPKEQPSFRFRWPQAPVNKKLKYPWIPGFGASTKPEMAVRLNRTLERPVFNKTSFALFRDDPITRLRNTILDYRFASTSRSLLSISLSTRRKTSTWHCFSYMICCSTILTDIFRNSSLVNIMNNSISTKIFNQHRFWNKIHFTKTSCRTKLLSATCWRKPNYTRIRIIWGWRSWLVSLSAIFLKKSKVSSIVLT